MLTGRFIYGLAGDNIAIAKTALIALWFDGSEMSFAFGCSLTIGRIGSVIGNFVSPKMANDWGVPETNYVGTLINAIGAIGSFVLLYLDRAITKKYGYDTCNDLELDASSTTSKENDKSDVIKDPYDGSAAIGLEEEKKDKKAKRKFRASDIKKFDCTYWLLLQAFVIVSSVVIPFNSIASGLLLERDLFKETPSTCQIQFGNRCTEGNLAHGANPALDIVTNETCPQSRKVAPAIPTQLNISYNEGSSDWDLDEYVYNNITMFDVRCTDEFWRYDCTQNYCEAQDEATEAAGFVMSIPYMVSAVFAIPLGLVVDKIGRRPYIATVGFAILFGCHFALAHSDVKAEIPLVFQGLAHAAYGGVLWPSIPLVVDPTMLGTAYGVMLSIQNAFLALIPMLVAFLYQLGNSHYIPNVEILFYSLSAFGVALGVALIIEDRRTGNRLNMAYTKEPGPNFAVSTMSGENLSKETVNEYISDAFS